MDDLMVILGFPVHPSFAGDPLVNRFPIGSTGKDPGISPKTAASAEEAAKRKALEAGEAPQKYQVVLLHMAIICN